MYKAESAISDLNRMEEVLSESSECNWGKYINIHFKQFCYP